MNEHENYFIIYSLNNNNIKPYNNLNNIEHSFNDIIIKKMNEFLDNKKNELKHERSFSDFIIYNNISFICIFSLLKNNNDKESSFLLCLLKEQKDNIQNNISLMLSDINNYIIDIICPLLDNLNDNIDKLQNLLSDWYSCSVDYMGVCFDILNDKLSYFIHGSMLGYLFKVENDLILNNNLTRLAQMIQVTHKEEDEIISCSFIDNKINFNYNKTNEFCNEWSNNLMETRNNPSSCKHKLEQLRLSVVKRLNDVRRLLDSARMHNHDLYKSYYIIHNTNNQDILLSILMSDIKQNPNLEEVILSIAEYSK